MKGLIVSGNYSQQFLSMRTLEFRQFLPMTMDEAWAFFSQPANLGRITPPGMNFVIRSAVPGKIYPGLIILYRVSPLAGIPLRWATEITHVDEPHFFVDEQRSGPYAIWHHEHHFEAFEGGVMMTDRLFYKVPGIFGRILDRLLVRKKVEGIFAYRTEALEGLFKNNR
jgi:ligand-binding SRPBCC domain-containing protein